ncbi:MAG: VOC family protein [Rhodospirillales bacterium]|nr:VOC family protein [Rhodospirillales bacterium]
MNAPRIDHIGILVEDLDTAAASLERLLPGAPQRRRSLPEVGLEVVEFTTANVIIELLAYTDPGDGFGRAVMGSQMGVNHVSLEVSDLDAALAELRSNGVEPTAGFPRQGAHGRIAFLPRDPHTGLLFELCQSDDESHEH